MVKLDEKKWVMFLGFVSRVFRPLTYHVYIGYIDVHASI